MAFGQEFGRVLSDGQIVGRAEPFAKVFASSRAVKRAVGVMAWAILEDIALEARLDREGRLVADTNVRQIADNLGLSKNTVAKHLGRLRHHGFVLHEEHRANDSGLYATSRYVLDPSACLERFTHTPTDQPVHIPVDNTPITDRAGSATEDVSRPCTNSWDTDEGTVSQSVGHRGLGHNNKEVVVPEEEQQHQSDRAERDRLRADLVALGIPPGRVERLLVDHDAGRIADAILASRTDEVRNPAGWVVAALARGWTIPTQPPPNASPFGGRVAAGDQPARPASPPPMAAPQPDPDAVEQDRRGRAWAVAAAELVNDDTLAAFVAVETDGPLAGFAVTGPRLLRARIAGRLAAAHLARPEVGLVDAVRAALPRLADLELAGPLPACPHRPAPAATPADLDARLQRLTARPARRSTPPVTAGMPPRS